MARISELAGDLKRATEHASKAASFKPSSAFLQKIYASYLLKNNNNNNEVENLFSEFDDDSQSHTFFALLSIKRGDLQKARSEVNTAINLDPLNTDARMASGLIYLLNKEYPLSISEFRIAREDESQSAFSYYATAVAYLYLNKIDKASNAASVAHALNPLSEQCIGLYTDILIELQEYDKAIDVISKFLKIYPKTEKILEKNAFALFKSLKFSKCINSLRMLASISDTSRVWNNLSVVYSSLGDKRRSSQYYAYALEKMKLEGEPNYVLLNNFVRFLNSKNKCNDAIKTVNPLLRDLNYQDIEKDKHLASLYLNYLLSHIESDKEVDLGLFNKIAFEKNISDEIKVDYLMFGAFYYSLINPTRVKALEYADEILIFICKNPKVSTKRLGGLENNVAFILTEFGNLKDAKKSINGISQLIHHSPEATATLGLWHLKRGDIEKGKEYYLESIRISHDDVLKQRIKSKMNLELAKLYFGEKNLGRGLVFLKRATKADGERMFRGEIIKLERKVKLIVNNNSK